MVRMSASIVLALSVCGAAHATMLMKVSSLPPGDATLPGYQGWTSLTSMQFSIDRNLTDSGPKGGTEDINIGVGEIDRFHLTKAMGAGSTELFLFAINGNSLGTVDLRIVTPGVKSSVPTAAWRLDRAFVTSYSMSSTNGAPVEEFSLYFNRIAFATVVDGIISVKGWDLVTNKAWTNHGLDTDLTAELGKAKELLPGDFALNADATSWRGSAESRPSP